MANEAKVNIGIIENLNKMIPLANVPTGSFHSAMRKSLKIDALINPYHPDKYTNFRSKYTAALLNQSGTHTAKALLRTGVIVNPSFTMVGLIHDRYFSSINRFAGLLGRFASYRQMDFAAKLQRLQPLLNPECVHNVSRLAGCANLAFNHQWYDTEFQEMDIDARKRETIDVLLESLPDSENLESPYTIGFYQVWKEIPDKAHFLGIVLDLAHYFWYMSSITIDSIDGGTYLLTAKALVEIYVLGSKFLAPAIKEGGKNNVDAGAKCDNLENDIGNL